MNIRVFNESYLEKISHPIVAYGVFTLALLVGGLVSWLASDWSWFSRAGAVATVGGIFASLRPKYAGFEEGYYTTTVYNEADDPVFIEHNVENEWLNLAREQQNARIRRNGTILVVIATFIWGFGDLLGLLFR